MGAAASTPTNPRSDPHRKYAVLAIVVAAGVAIAGTLTWEHTIQSSSGSPLPSPPPGWATFRSAVALVGPVVAATPDGPWNLTFAEAVAADGPWAPTVVGTFTTEKCALSLSGVSVFSFWNRSEYPRTDSPNVFTSGAAPLWSFLYSNASRTETVLTVMNGSVITNGQWSESSGCGWTDGTSILPGEVANTPQLVEAEMMVPSQAWLGFRPDFNVSMPSLAEVYSLGNPLYAVGFPAGDIGGGGSAPYWSATWGQCGLPNAPIRTPAPATWFNSTSLNWTGEFIGGNAYCSNVAFIGNLSSPIRLSGHNLTSPAIQWNLTVDPETSWVPAPANWSRLSVDGLVPSISVNGTSGPPYSVSIPSSSPALCGPGTSSVDNCSTPSTGWYVVLSDSDGNWIDSFPSTANGSAWTVPGIAITSGDSLTLLTSNWFADSEELQLTLPGLWPLASAFANQ